MATAEYGNEHTAQEFEYSFQRRLNQTRKTNNSSGRLSNFENPNQVGMLIKADKHMLSFRDLKKFKEI